MTRTSLDHHNCSFARTVDIIGDQWSLMILRDAFYGVRRFGEFKRRLGVTQGVLAARLAHLVEHDILERQPVSEGAAREAYKLTVRGRALFPVVVALTQWGDCYLHNEEGAPVRLFDKRTGAAVDRIDVRSAGEAVKLSDIGFEPGPGAQEATIAEFESMVGGGGSDREA